MDCCAEVGLGEQFSRVRQSMEGGVFPACAKKALSEDGLVVSDPASRCTSCIQVPDDAGRACFTARLSRRDQVYGLLSVSTSAARAHNREEQKLFAELAQDVGQALYLL